MITTTIQERWAVDQQDFPYGGDNACRYEFLLRYAILAPSGHNTQPWLFEVCDEGITLHADPTRALPVVDPHNRALVISCGCALENLCVSARFFGFEPLVEYENEEGETDLLARFSFGERSEADELEKALFQAIPNRHTNRAKFDTTSVPVSVHQQVRLLAGLCGVTPHFLVELSDRQSVARLVSEGDRIQASDPSFRRELAAWVHHNRTHSHDGMPGFAFGTGDFTSLLGPFMVRTFDWGKGQAAKDEQLVMGSPLLIALNTPTDTRNDWLNTGRALSKVLLFLTSQGLSASFLNQPVEVDDLRVALKQELGGVGEPQILLRIGHGPQANPTPRRPIEEIMLKSDG